MVNKKKRQNNFSLKEEYKKSFDYLKNSKNFIYSAIIIFLIFLAIGLFFQDLVNLIFRNLFGVNLNQLILDFIKQLLEKTQGMNQKELIGFIFVNNLLSSFVGLAVGSIFAIIPLFSCITNGYLLGYVLSVSVKVEGIMSIWKLFPHGIFELPAVFISLGLGFRLGTYPFHSNNKERAFLSMFAFVFLFSITYLILSIISPKGIPFLYYFLVALAILTIQDRKMVIGLIKNSAITFLLVVLPLLILAAFIEGSLIVLGD